MAEPSTETLAHEQVLVREGESNRVRWAEEFEDVIAGFLLALLFAVLVLQVFSRYVMGAPFGWTEEVARYLFIAMVFVGAAGAMRLRAHIAIEIVVELLPRRLRYVTEIVSDLLCLVFLVLLFYWSSRALSRVWDTTSTAVEMPMGILYSVVPISAVLMIGRILQRMRADLRAFQKQRVT